MPYFRPRFDRVSVKFSCSIGFTLSELFEELLYYRSHISHVSSQIAVLRASVSKNFWSNSHTVGSNLREFLSQLLYSSLHFLELFVEFPYYELQFPSVYRWLHFEPVFCRISLFNRFYLGPVFQDYLYSRQHYLGFSLERHFRLILLL